MERNTHFRFTVDGVDYDFECRQKDLASYFAANFPNYTLHIVRDPGRYDIDELDYYVQYTQWVPSDVNPHKGEKRTITVEFQLVDVQPTAKVAYARSLDFDHPRTQIGQTQRGCWPGKKLAEVEDEQACKRSHGQFRFLDSW